MIVSFLLIKTPTLSKAMTQSNRFHNVGVYCQEKIIKGERPLYIIFRFSPMLCYALMVQNK